MKKIKSIFAIILIFAMLFTLGACDKGVTTSDDGKTSVKEPDDNAQTFTIAVAAYYEDEFSWNQDTEYGEAIRQMITEIEGEENIRIKIDYYSPTEFTSIAQTSITNGDTGFADLMIHQLFSFGPLAAQDLLMNLSGLESLEVNSDRWNSVITNIASVKGGIYGVGSNGLMGYAGMSCLYNRDMIKTLGLTDPAELVRKGEWTWDKFREYSLKAVKDMNNDGKFDANDRLGSTSQAYDGLVPVWLAAGVPMIKKDADGRLVYNMLDKSAVTALQKFKTTFTVNDGMFYPGDMDGITQQNFFLDGNCLFLLGGYTSDSEDSGKFEIGIIPYPKYNKESDYISAQYHNTNIITIPAISETSELAAKVLKKMADKSKDFQSLQIQDGSANFVDRDLYIEMMNDYIVPTFSLDYANLMLNINEQISIGTMRAVAMPIFTDTTYSLYTEGNAAGIQALIDEMFN